MRPVATRAEDPHDEQSWRSHHCAQGKWDVPHFSAKAHVADYIREKHAGMISIFPSVAAFYTNFLEYARPKCATL